jgi:hypothetical protein
VGRPELAEVVSLDAHRRAPLPGIRAEATTGGEVSIVLRRSTGELISSVMSLEHARAFLLQLTDAVELAEGIARA